MQKVALTIVLLAGSTLTGCGLCTCLLGETSSARVRVIHASPDAPAVDVCVDGAVAFAGAAFPGATDYAELAPGTYAVRVIPADAGC